MTYKEFERMTGVKLKWWQKIHCSCKTIIRRLNPNHPCNKFKRFAKKYTGNKRNILRGNNI